MASGTQRLGVALPALDQRFGLWPVAVAGLASIGLYWVAFTRPYPLAEWWQFAKVDYATISEYALESQLVLVGAFLALFGVYSWAIVWLRHTRPDAAALPLIVGVQAVAGLVLVAMQPIAALDVYDYVLYARLGLYWGANPLVQTPSMYPAEPTLGFSYWPNEPSVYGPVWQSVSERVIGLVDGQVVEGLGAFKLLALAAALATTLLVWLMLRRLRPELAAAGTLVWAWNPLQLFETAGNAHNDALMVLALAVAVYALVAGRLLWCLPALTIGLLVKVTLAPIAPLFAALPLLSGAPWRRRVIELIGSVLLSLAVAVLAYAPYWQGRASLPFLDRGNWFTASPPTLVRELLRGSLPFEVAGQRAAMICAAAFAAIAIALVVRLAIRQWRTNGATLAPEAIETAYHVFFAYLVLACLWWQPWYLIVLVLLAALTSHLYLVTRTSLFCIGGVLSYVVFKYIWQIHQVDWQLDYLKIMALSVMVIFPLPLLHLAWHHRPRRLAREL